MCLRGNWSSSRHPLPSHVDLVCSEGRLDSGGPAGFFQLSSTLTASAGGGGKGSPSSPGRKKQKTKKNSKVVNNML